MSGTYYIAGPMRSVVKWNFPAFDRATLVGRGLGFKVISPAELDRAIGFTEDHPTSAVDDAFIEAAIERDLAEIRKLRRENGDGVALLPGWERSDGATAELALAIWKKLNVLNAETWRPFTRSELDQVSFAGLANRIREKISND